MHYIQNGRLFNSDKPQNDLQNSYFNYICGKIVDSKYSFGKICPDKTWFELLAFLHRKEFYSIHPMDINRESDGKELRTQFFEQFGLFDLHKDDDFIHNHAVFLEGPCSVLEMMISLSSRCGQMVTLSPGFLVFSMIKNLELDKFDDNSFYNIRDYDKIIRKKIDIMLERDYDANGKGGLWPLKTNLCQKDMRNEEIWYQMMFWLRENGYVDIYLVK